MIAVALLIYFVCIVGILVFSSLLGKVINKYCGTGVPNPVKELLRVYWIGVFTIIGITAALALTMSWSYRV